MDRRAFLSKSLGIYTVMANPDLLASFKANPKLRFGLVTDLHFARAETVGTRYYSQSIIKLNDAINLFNTQDMDFIIELGDFKDEGRPSDRQETIDFLAEIENAFQDFRGPLYHVLGNHDMDSISKEDFLTNIKNHGQEKAKNYYSFVSERIKFIVLDANYNEDGSDYDAGNFHWTYSMVPDDQRAWLDNELKNSSLPALIFVHQLLDPFSGVSGNHCVRNADEVTEILEKYNNVIAVFQGHYHSGNHSYRNGIHYFTMSAMVEGSLPENNSYAIVEIDGDLNINIQGFANSSSILMKRL